MQQEQSKQERKIKSHEQREAEEKRMFELKQQKRRKMMNIEEKKKLKSKKKKGQSVFIGIIVTTVVLICLSKYLLPVIGIGLLTIGSASAKVEVYDDVSDYGNFIGENRLKDYLFHDNKGIFPMEITPDVKPLDYKFVYYNPWDAQYVTYLTLQYTKDDYKEERERLAAIGEEEYTEFYSVTGEPEGYNIVAMDSDKYEGFIYAMVPEEEDASVTYVGIQFCNYFLNLDINDYLPQEYLLAGFDATAENPYRKTIMKE